MILAETWELLRVDCNFRIHFALVNGQLYVNTKQNAYMSAGLFLRSLYAEKSKTLSYQAII